LTEPKRLTEGDKSRRKFSWSPDGARIAFSRRRFLTFIVLEDIYVVQSRQVREEMWIPDRTQSEMVRPMGRRLRRDGKRAGEFFYYRNQRSPWCGKAAAPQILTEAFDEDQSVGWAGWNYFAANRKPTRISSSESGTKTIEKLRAGS